MCYRVHYIVQSLIIQQKTCSFGRFLHCLVQFHRGLRLMFENNGLFAEPAS